MKWIEIGARVRSLEKERPWPVGTFGTVRRYDIFPIVAWETPTGIVERPIGLGAEGIEWERVPQDWERVQVGQIRLSVPTFGVAGGPAPAPTTLVLDHARFARLYRAAMQVVACDARFFGGPPSDDVLHTAINTLRAALTALEEP